MLEGGACSLELRRRPPLMNQTCDSIPSDIAEDQVVVIRLDDLLQVVARERAKSARCAQRITRLDQVVEELRQVPTVRLPGVERVIFSNEGVGKRRESIDRLPVGPEKLPCDSSAKIRFLQRYVNEQGPTPMCTYDSGYRWYPAFVSLIGSRSANIFRAQRR